MYKQSAKLKLRFPSNRGPVTVEDLFDMPLTSKSGFSLNDIAKVLNKEVGMSAEEDFVGDSSPTNPLAVLKLDVVKDVIAHVKADLALVKARSLNSAKRARLQSLIANKQNEADAELTLEELVKMEAELV